MLLLPQFASVKPERKILMEYTIYGLPGQIFQMLEETEEDKWNQKQTLIRIQEHFINMMIIAGDNYFLK